MQPRNNLRYLMFEKFHVCDRSLRRLVFPHCLAYPVPSNAATFVYTITGSKLRDPLLHPVGQTSNLSVSRSGNVSGAAILVSCMNLMLDRAAPTGGQPSTRP